MSNKVTNKQPNEEKKEFVKNLNVTITKVFFQKDVTNRLTFVTNKEFETINMKTREVEMTTNFSLNVFEIVNQIGASVPEIQLADMLALGKQVNPQIIALALTNADMEIKREFKAQGEQRLSTDDVYTNDCWKTTIVKVTTHIAPMFAAMIQKLVTTQPAIVTIAAVPNPFDVI